MWIWGKEWLKPDFRGEANGTLVVVVKSNPTPYIYIQKERSSEFKSYEVKWELDFNCLFVFFFLKDNDCDLILSNTVTMVWLQLPRFSFRRKQTANWALLCCGHDSPEHGLEGCLSGTSPSSPRGGHPSILPSAIPHTPQCLRWRVSSPLNALRLQTWVISPWLSFVTPL